MNQIQHHDAVLAYLLDQTRSTLHAALTGQANEYAANMQNMQQRIEELGQDKVKLYDAVDEANAYAKKVERWAAHLFTTLESVLDPEEVATVREQFENEEAKRDTERNAANAPKDAAFDHVCNSCFADTGPCTGSCAVGGQAPNE